MSNDKVEMALEAKARRAAKRVSLYAKKSRSRNSWDNWGGFMLVDSYTNIIECGWKFDLTSEEVIEYCKQ